MKHPAVSFCTSLMLATAVFFSASHPFASVSSETAANTSVGAVPDNVGALPGPTALTRTTMALTMGASSDSTELLCAAIAGAGLAFTLTGVGGPVGIALGLAGAACTLFA